MGGIVIHIVFFLFFILALCFKDLELLPHANKKNSSDKSSDLGAFLASYAARDFMEALQKFTL